MKNYSAEQLRAAFYQCDTRQPFTAAQFATILDNKNAVEVNKEAVRYLSDAVAEIVILVQKMLKHLGMKQIEFCNELNADPTQLNKAFIERGDEKPTRGVPVDVLCRLSEEMEISLSELLYRTSMPTPLLRSYTLLFLEGRKSQDPRKYFSLIEDAQKASSYQKLHLETNIDYRRLMMQRIKEYCAEQDYQRPYFIIGENEFRRKYYTILKNDTEYCGGRLPLILGIPLSCNTNPDFFFREDYAKNIQYLYDTDGTRLPITGIEQDVLSHLLHIQDLDERYALIGKYIAKFSMA